MKNCIVYLVNHREQEIKDFLKSLLLLEKHFLKTHAVDVIVFHEKEFNIHIENIKNIFPNILFKFQELNFTLDYSKEILNKIPEYFPHPTHGNGPIAWGHPGFTIGYRHMCNFFAGEIYNQKILENYDYYMRLDTDSFILREVQENIFDKMKKLNSFYGFIGEAIQLDNPKVTIGLYNFIKNYIETNKIETLTTISNIKENGMFYNNFEIGKISWFKESKYMQFYEEIKKFGGIYTNRWGDAPIRYLILNLIMPQKNFLNITEIAYQHGAIYNLK